MFNHTYFHPRSTNGTELDSLPPVLHAQWHFSFPSRTRRKKISQLFDTTIAMLVQYHFSHVTIFNKFAQKSRHSCAFATF